MARTPLRSRLLQTAGVAPVLLFVGKDAPPSRIEQLRSVEGVGVIPGPLDVLGHIDLTKALCDLGHRGLTRIFSEGGPTVAASLLDDGLVDEVALFTAAKPLAREGVPTLPPSARAVLDDTNRFRLAETAQIGQDRLRLYEGVA
jgi:diaminohydroxyphosphoribosylaminopyrimidine deaminase/5-amino-6-(5-phosphoribosylamino)uracil reductase